MTDFISYSLFVDDLDQNKLKETILSICPDLLNHPEKIFLNQCVILHRSLKHFRKFKYIKEYLDKEIKLNSEILIKIKGISFNKYTSAFIIDSLPEFPLSLPYITIATYNNGRPEDLDLTKFIEINPIELKCRLKMIIQ